jgi:hypothetical protein
MYLRTPPRFSSAPATALEFLGYQANFRLTGYQTARKVFFCKFAVFPSEIVIALELPTTAKVSIDSSVSYHTSSAYSRNCLTHQTMTKQGCQGALQTIATQNLR